MQKEWYRNKNKRESWVSKQEAKWAESKQASSLAEPESTATIVRYQLEPRASCRRDTGDSEVSDGPFAAGQTLRRSLRAKRHTL